MGRRWLAALACIAALLSAGPTGAAPSYMSYFGLAWNIPETQDHVNLYWAVSWDWDSDEILSELADAKARGMRAIVHTEFAFFNGSGQYANTCPYTLRPDAAARWASFAQALSNQGLLDTVAAFYPVDEPDLCGLSSNTVLTVLGIIRSHPLTAGKPVAVIFTCDIAKKYGGTYQITGGHQYGNAVRAYDWVGVDCYGNKNIFTDPAWTTIEFDISCFCFRSIPGPSYYDNLKAQLNLSWQRLILVPQGFIAAESDGLPDDPQLFASHAAADPSVILMAPFTWFDQLFYPGVRSQPALAQQWRSIGRSIAMSNPPNANPPLPAAVPPRLQVSASDVQHFSVYDLTCNTTNADICAVQLFWQAVNNLGTQLFVRQGAAAPQLITCSAATSYIDIPWISGGINFTFDLYQMGSCAPTIAGGATPIASVNMSLVTPMVGLPPILTGAASRKVHGTAGTFDLALASTPTSPTTEPRSGGGGHTIVFTFDKAVTSGSAAIAMGAATVGIPMFNGNQMLVPLTSVTNARYVTVSVSNVASADGGTGGNGSVRIGFLVGDTTGNRNVSLSDLLWTDAALSQTVSTSNFLRDVNANGALSLSDLLVIDAYLSRVLPAP